MNPCKECIYEQRRKFAEPKLTVYGIDSSILACDNCFKRREKRCAVVFVQWFGMCWDVILLHVCYKEEHVCFDSQRLALRSHIRTSFL